jgi:hypothetical protein
MILYIYILRLAVQLLLVVPGSIARPIFFQGFEAICSRHVVTGSVTKVCRLPLLDILSFSEGAHLAISASPVYSEDRSAKELLGLDDVL